MFLTTMDSIINVYSYVLMNEWMNLFRHAFSSNNRPKNTEAEQNDKIQGTQKK